MTERQTKTFTIGRTAIGPEIVLEAEPMELGAEPEVLRFDCLTEPPLGVLNDYIDAYSDRGGTGNQTKALTDFILGCLSEEGERRFVELTRSKRLKLDAEAIAEISNFLVEAYTGRPFGKPSGSSPGPTSTEATSQPPAPSGA